MHATFFCMPVLFKGSLQILGKANTKDFIKTIIVLYAYPVAAGESGKLAAFSASYLKMVQNMPGK